MKIILQYTINDCYALVEQDLARKGFGMINGDMPELSQAYQSTYTSEENVLGADEPFIEVEVVPVPTGFVPNAPIEPTGPTDQAGDHTETETETQEVQPEPEPATKPSATTKIKKKKGRTLLADLPAEEQEKRRAKNRLYQDRMEAKKAGLTLPELNTIDQETTPAATVEEVTPPAPVTTVVVQQPEVVAPTESPFYQTEPLLAGAGARNGGSHNGNGNGKN